MTEGDERRAPVQGNLLWALPVDHRDRPVDAKPPGTISWDEHEEAWRAYDAKYHSGQSAERIAERGGFAYAELVEFLSWPPKTWRKR